MDYYVNERKGSIYVQRFLRMVRYSKCETTTQKAFEKTIPYHILNVQFERKISNEQSNLLC